MTQTINTNEVKKTSPNKPTIKVTVSIKEAKSELKRITERTSGSFQDEAIKIVKEILNNVRTKGDDALKEYTSRFDGFLAESLQVSTDLITKAWEDTPKALQDSLLLAKKKN